MYKKIISLISFICLVGIILPAGSLNAQDQLEDINTGFVFVDGKYLDVSYKVEAHDLAVYINGVQITRKLEWPVVNKYAFDHDPGIPPNVTKYTTLEEASKLREPTRGILYYAAKQWYLFTHYSYDEAFEKTIQYFLSLPYVKSLTKEPDGGWILESYAGEKRHILFGGPIMRRVNEIWGPEGSGPPTKDELIKRVNKLSLRYKNRLEKGDLFLIFLDENELSFAERKAAILLPEMLDVMSKAISDEEKVNELISFGIFPRVDKKLCRYFVANFEASHQLEERINTLRQKIIERYGEDALKPLERDLDLKMRNEKENQMMKGENRSENTRGTAYSPDGTFLYGWCGYTYDPAFSNFPTEITSVGDYIKDQDYNVTTCIYTDDSGEDADCEDCTYNNLKNMKYADFLYYACHGWEQTDGGYIEMLLLQTEDQINNWSGNDTLLVIAVEITGENWPTGHPWAACGTSAWPTNYWNSMLTQSKSITILSCCYSFENGWAATCGGGVAFGYNTWTTGGACENNNEQLLRRMNGQLDNTAHRKAGEAYSNMPSHLREFRIVPANADITLCPATEDYDPADGDFVGCTGTGYFEVDTYCHNTVPADEALTFTTTGPVTISNIHWVDCGQPGKAYRIEYDWNAPDPSLFSVTVYVHHDKFHSWGAATASYHKLDVNRVTPNTEDGEYTFYGCVLLITELTLPEDATGYPGESVSIPITLNNPDEIEIEGINITITFDEDVIDATGATLEGGVLEDWDYGFFANTDVDGEIRLVFYAQGNLYTGDGIIAYLEFDVVGEEGTYSDLVFTFGDVNETQVALHDGYFTVVPCTFDISGFIGYYDGLAPVPNVDVNITGDLLFYTATTDEFGEYLFPDIPGGFFESTSEPYTGPIVLSGLDASRIARFSVGLYSFNCMQWIASDVSLNGFTSGMDASRVARYSVGLIDAMNPEDIEWVFPVEWILDCPDWEPIVYENTYYYAPLESDLIDQDFFGIILGDVSGNWPPDVREPITYESFEITEIETDINSTLKIPIVIEEETQIEGIDISIAFDPEVLHLTELTLKDGILSEHDYAVETNIKDGKMVIYALKNLIVEKGTVAFIEFEVIGAVGSKTDVYFTKFDVNETEASGGLQVVDSEGNEVVTRRLEVNVVQSIPDKFALYPNYPNPFKTHTTISYALPEATNVKIQIYNIRGQLVAELVNGFEAAGNKKLVWNPEGLTNGIYFCNISTEKNNEKIKLLLMK